MNLIKVFAGGSFIGKYDDVLIVEYSQRMKICALQNRLVAAL